VWKLFKGMVSILVLEDNVSLLKQQILYDPEWESKFLNIEKRNDIAKWDEKGNLIS
jgi:hypothetical protein